MADLPIRAIVGLDACRLGIQPFLIVGIG